MYGFHKPVEHFHPEVLNNEEFHIGHAFKELGYHSLNGEHLGVFKELARVVVADTKIGEVGMVAQSLNEVALPPHRSVQ